MGYYRPRPSEMKTCKQCGVSFLTNHKRTIYCGNPCRQLAYQTRHGLGMAGQEQPVRKAAGTLDFSLHNVATIGAGVLAADATKAGLNALFDVQPTNAQIMAKLASIEKQFGELSAIREHLRTISINQTDQIKAEALNDPQFRQALETVHQARLKAAQGLNSPTLPNSAKRGINSAGR